MRIEHRLTSGLLQIDISFQWWYNKWEEAVPD